MLIDRITTGSSTVSSGVSAGGSSVVISQVTSSVSSAGTSVDLSQGAGLSQSYENKLNISSSANMIASNISVADKAMAMKAETLTEMKQTLNTTLREFDYQPLKNNKLKLLGDYVALRMLMVRDTVPPEFEFAWKITTEDEDQTVSFGSDGPSVTVRSQSVAVGGSSGIDVPELPATATKEQISAAIETIDRTQKTINVKRTSLASDAATVADSLAQTVKTDIPLIIPDGKITDKQAEDKSSEIKQTIPSYSDAGITGDMNALLRTFL
jgi:hypothetical protein